MVDSSLTSKTLYITKFYAEGIEFKEESLKMESNQSIMKVHYAPIIHYDLMKMSGVTGAQLPYTPCVECSGVVEESSNKDLIGKKVGLLSLFKGTLRTRLVVNNSDLFVLDDNSDLFKSSIVSCNPLTAYGIVDTAIQLKVKAFALTAANSQVGKMIIKFANEKGIKVISIVRSEKRQLEMQNEGFSNVINSSTDSFVADLKALMLKLEANVVMETLSGPIAGQMLKALPPKGVLVNFGTQTHEPMSGIDATDMRWGNKTMTSFLVGTWISTKSEKEMSEIRRFILDNFSAIFECPMGKEFSINEMKEAHDHANKDTSGFKTIMKVIDN